MDIPAFRAEWKRILSLVWRGKGTPSGVLKSLIREVEESAGYARNDARAKAKTWLIRHVSSLDPSDLLLARDHFGYLLPAGWGSSSK